MIDKIAKQRITTRLLSEIVNSYGFMAEPDIYWKQIIDAVEEAIESIEAPLHARITELCEQSGWYAETIEEQKTRIEELEAALNTKDEEWIKAYDRGNAVLKTVAELQLARLKAKEQSK